MPYLYAILCDIRPDVYVGHTDDPHKRMQNHRATHPLNSNRLHRLMQELGYDHFKLTILQHTPITDKAELEKLEYLWMKRYQPEHLLNVKRSYRGKPSGTCRRWVLQMDRTKPMPTDLAIQPTVRYLCYNKATGAAYMELYDSRTPAHITKAFLTSAVFLSITRKPKSLAREDAVAAVDPDVRLGHWQRQGQGCRSDLPPKSPPASPPATQQTTPTTAPTVQPTRAAVA